MLPRKKRKRELKWYEIWYLKAEKECKRKNERGNEQVRKKTAKRRVSAKRKTNISDLKTKKKETQIRDKPKHGEEAKQELKLKKNCFLLFIAGVALNPSFSNCDAERSADHNDGETFTHKESRRSKLAWNHISNKSIQNTVDQR